MNALGREPTELNLELPELTLTARGWGPEGARPILALHGWLDNAASFERLAPRLEHTRLVAPDLPGHGLSPWRPAGDAYHFVDWVGDVLDVADALGWGRFTLLGHSMGGAISTLVAGAAPARVDAMLLLDALGPTTTPAGGAPRRLGRALAKQRRARSIEPPTYPDREAALERMLAARTPIAEGSARRLLARGTTTIDEGGDSGRIRFAHDPALHGSSRLQLTEEQVLAFLESIECPSLLVRPRGGWPAQEEMMRRRIDAIEGLQIEHVPGGHHAHLDEPEPIAEVITAFLDELDGRGEAGP